MKKPLFEDDETYHNDEGFVVFTEKYLLQRGYCCGNGCLHCPYDYKNVQPIEKRKKLLEARTKKNENDK